MARSYRSVVSPKPNPLAIWLQRDSGWSPDKLQAQSALFKCKTYAAELRGSRESRFRTEMPSLPFVLKLARRELAAPTSGMKPFITSDELEDGNRKRQHWFRPCAHAIEIRSLGSRRSVRGESDVQFQLLFPGKREPGAQPSMSECYWTDEIAERDK
jgi:hypothetical protein